MTIKVMRRTARVAGLLYLIVFVLGPLGEFLVRQSLIVPGDAATTASNIMASESLFRLGFVSDLVRQMVLVLLPLVLYKLLRPVDKDIAAAMLVFALVAAPVAMLSLLNQFAARYR